LWDSPPALYHVGAGHKTIFFSTGSPSPNIYLLTDELTLAHAPLSILAHISHIHYYHYQQRSIIILFRSLPRRLLRPEAGRASSPMQIKELQVTNFRNYISARIEPGHGMNILVGPNAHGKSNLLEAIYLLATTKSHKTNRDSDLIKADQQIARVFAEAVREQQNDITLEVILSRAEKKTVKINTVRHARIADAIGQLNCVIFSAEDLVMVKGEPCHRRRFLNLEIAQISGQYCYALGGYKRALLQRNALLKEIKTGREAVDTLDAWDAQLSAYGSIMAERRSGFVRRLAVIASRIHSELTDSVETLEMEYEPGFSLGGTETADEVAAAFGSALAESRAHDIARGNTLKGPHRDDVAFRVEGLDLRHFGSQGQQRTAALAVKLAEIELVQDIAGESPVVLLDDVMAELDDDRRDRVFNLASGDRQTFATGTALGEFPASVIAAGVVFNTWKGELTRQ